MLFLKLELSLALINAPAIVLPKLAILCLYLRLFTGKIHQYAVYVTATVLILTWVIYFGLQMGICTPFSFHWDKSIPHGKCLNEFAMFIWIGIPSIVTDLAMIILPLPIIWGLQTSTSQKIGLTITFLTGSVGIVTAIIRFAVLLGLGLNNPELDLSWLGVDIVTWITIEPGLYLIAACLPNLRPLVKVYGVPKPTSLFRRKDNKPSAAESDIHLSSTAGTTKEGFRRMDDYMTWNAPGFGNGNGDNEQVICYRQQDSEEGNRPATSSLAGLAGLTSSQLNRSILVQKDFTVSTEPAGPYARYME